MLWNLQLSSIFHHHIWFIWLFCINIICLWQRQVHRWQPQKLHQHQTVSYDIIKILTASTSLTCSANLPTGLYILRAWMFSFFKLSQIISGCTWPILRLFHQMEGICVNFIDPDLFFQFLSGNSYGNWFLAKLAKLLSFNTLVFRKWFKYRNYDCQV